MKTPRQCLKEMKELTKNRSDIEQLHIDADELLCECLLYYGHKELIEAYDEVEKWYA